MNVLSFVIFDSIEQLCPVLELQLVPDDGEDLLSINTYMPEIEVNGERLSLDGYQVISAQQVDTEDGTTWRVTMGQNVQSQPWNRATTLLFPSPTPEGGVQRAAAMFQDGFSHALGVATNLNMLPDYPMSGCAEFIQMTFLQALNVYLQPFNICPYYQHIIRYTNNALTALVLDFSRTQRGRYTPAAIKTIAQSRQRYEEMIYGRAILCTGGERVVDNPDLNVYTATGTINVRSEFTSNVNTQVFAEETTWGEGYTDYEVTLQLGRQAVDGFTILPTLEENVAQLRSGIIDSLRVVKTKVVTRVERQMSRLNGLLSERTTSYTYGDRVFRNGVYIENGIATVDCGRVEAYPAQEVLLEEMSVEYLYWQGTALPSRMVHIYHNWNELGVKTSSVTLSYMYLDGGWELSDTSVSFAGLEEINSALIQFWSSYNANLKGLRADVVRRAKPPLYQWMMLDGVVHDPDRFRFEDCSEQIFDDFVGTFDIVVPCAMHEGLRLAYRIAQKQRQLETDGAYWEAATFEMPIDFSVNLGQAFGTTSANGYVVAYRHEVTQDSATTVVNTRKMVV